MYEKSYIKLSGFFTQKGKVKLKKSNILNIYK